MLFSTLKLRAKFLMNSSEETDGPGNFSFLRALLITDSVIGVDFLSIGICLIVTIYKRTMLINSISRENFLRGIYYLWILPQNP